MLQTVEVAAARTDAEKNSCMHRMRTAGRTSKGRMWYQLAVVACLLVRCGINLIVMAASPGFNFTGRFLIVLAWSVFAGNLSGLTWNFAVLTCAVGFVAWEATFLYLWLTCDTEPSCVAPSWSSIRRRMIPNRMGQQRRQCKKSWNSYAPLN